jgi:hypothetical protein
MRAQDILIVKDAVNLLSLANSYVCSDPVQRTALKRALTSLRDLLASKGVQTCLDPCPMCGEDRAHPSQPATGHHC